MPRRSTVSFEGIAAEAVLLLQSKSVSSRMLSVLARMSPSRQAEVARLMVAAGCYDALYARALISATGRSLLSGTRAHAKVAMSSRNRRAAGQEIGALAGRLNQLSGIGGADLLTLMASRRYTERLLKNNRIRKYLEKNWPEICKDLADLVRAPMEL